MASFSFCMGRFNCFSSFNAIELLLFVGGLERGQKFGRTGCCSTFEEGASVEFRKAGALDGDGLKKGLLLGSVAEGFDEICTGETLGWFTG